MESLKNNYTIGMRFKMRFEGEEAPEQRYEWLIIQEYVWLLKIRFEWKKFLTQFDILVGLLVPLLEQKMLTPKGGLNPNGDASRLYL